MIDLERHDAGMRLGAAVDQVSGAAGPDPLSGAASELATQLDRAVQAIRTSLTDSAGALEASSTQYVTGDGRASAGLDGAVIHGFEGPR